MYLALFNTNESQLICAYRRKKERVAEATLLSYGWTRGYWITRTLYVVEVGVPAATQVNRTVTVFAEETNAPTVNPAPGSATGEA